MHKVFPTPFSFLVFLLILLLGGVPSVGGGHGLLWPCCRTFQMSPKWWGKPVPTSTKGRQEACGSSVWTCLGKGVCHLGGDSRGLLWKAQHLLHVLLHLKGHMWGHMGEDIRKLSERRHRRIHKTGACEGDCEETLLQRQNRIGKREGTLLGSWLQSIHGRMRTLSLWAAHAGTRTSLRGCDQWVTHTGPESSNKWAGGEEEGEKQGLV